MDHSRTGKLSSLRGPLRESGGQRGEAFSRLGARVGLVARGQAGLEGAKKDVERAGGLTIVLPTDVADPDQVEAAAEAVEREFGPIDVWVDDAMCSVFSPVKE